MSNISNLLDSAGNAHANQMAQTRGLVSKWEKTGLLEGIDAEYEKSGMAVLLENQARQLIDENSNTSNGTASKEQWSGVALPLVRRVFGEIAAKEFVSVQPMNLPSGLVFFLDFKYGDTVESGNPTFQSGTDLMGNTSASNADATGGLYGAGKFGYSLKNKSTSGITPTAQASASWKDVGFNSDLSASIASEEIVKLTFTTAQLTVDSFVVDTDALGGIYVSSSLTAYGLTGAASAANGLEQADGTLGEYATTDGSGNVVVFMRKLNPTTHPVENNTAIADAIVTFPVATTADLRSDFEATGDVDGTLAAQDVAIPQLDVELRSETIAAKTRKLKAAWSPEFAQDLNAYHSIDAEAELTSMLSEYISMEIDLEILDMLLSNAGTVDYWSAALGEVYDGTGTFLSPTAAEAYTQFTWFQTLGTKIQKVSNQIHQKTLRGGANFLVTSPEVATILESIPGYAANTDGNSMQFAMGVQKVGALNNRFTVYKNPYMKDNTILLGFRGGQFLETGAVYAPYIPLIMTPLVYDPTNFTPRKGVMTRYAKKMVRPEFYGKVYISGLNRL
tara:strand:- start:30226 stop:31911 length:1686 start_codon:yes stop_codon:yes gene_type:complete